MTPEQEHIVKPHLVQLRKHISDQAPKFTDALAAFLENPDDPTGLRVSKLRLQADGLKRSAELADSILAMLERKASENEE